jgi:hypothetical protein
MIFGFISKRRIKNNPDLWRGKQRANWMMAIPLLIIILLTLISAVADGNVNVWFVIGFGI